ncbi:hypothetical protein FBU31_003721, partial [Coemansia sp. 'formosensis']
MKQQSISSFFGGGGSSNSKCNGVDKDAPDKDKPKPDASKPDAKKSADEDVYKAETVVSKPVKPVLKVTRSFVDTDTAQSLEVKLHINEAANSTNSGTKKRRVVDSDDEQDGDV